MASSVADATVVITSYNQGDMIREAVSSVMAQTALPAEVIVVDDGSDDAVSLAVLGELEGESRSGGYPCPLCVIRQANAGPSAARNAGIREARTPYVAVLDGDDRLLPAFLERTVLELRRDPAAVAASGWLQTFGVLESVVRPTGGTLAAFLSRNCCPATCAIRRSAWAACGGYDESMRSGFEDWDFSISLLETSGDARIAVLPEPLVQYRTAAASPNIASMEKRLDLMRYLIGRHRGSYAAHIAEAVTGVEAVSMERLARWELAVRDCPEVIGASQPSSDFMAHPTYGDGGMAAAVRIRSLQRAGR